MITQKTVKLLFVLAMVSYPLCRGQDRDVSVVNMQVAVTVIDEKGEALEGAEVNARFHHSALQRKKNGNYVHKVTEIAKSQTPVEFVYTATPKVYLGVTLEGYWRSGVAHRFTQKERIDGKTDGSPNGHYRKEFTVVLRKKVNPRPLYVQASKYHPTQKFNTPMGYDLEVGDLIPPFGKGKETDIIFTLFRDHQDGGAYIHRLNISFPNPHDGIQVVKKQAGSDSKLLLGAQAPVEGYVSELNYRKGVEKRGYELWVTQDPEKSELENIEGCWIRVRSELDPETGEIRGRYGKIQGPISFLVDELGGAFYFTYYFSPDQSPSLEWDGKSQVPDANLQGVGKH